MSLAFQPRHDILPAAQRQLWPGLAGTAEMGYVLYDGTAIALRLGHRTSVDFDFFTDRPLNRKQLYDTFDFLVNAQTLQQSKDTLTVLATPDTESHTPVKVSFFGGIDFGRVGTPEYTTDNVLQVASPLDLLATKVKVILQRVEAKDYRDIAALIHGGTALADGVAAARTMFGNAFQPSETLKALTWFEGGDLDTLTDGERHNLITTVSGVGDLPRVDRASSQLAIAPAPDKPGLG